MSTLYDILTILPFSLLTVMLSGEYTGMPEGNLFGYALCLLFSLWIIVLRNMKRKNRLRSIGIVAVFIIGLMIAAGEENRQLFLREYLWVIWVICISAAALIAGMLMNRFIWVRRTAAVLLIAYLIAGTVIGLEISKEAFALISLIVIVRIAEEIQRKWKKSGCPDIREHITRISPVFLAVCIAVYALPAPDEPYDWQFAKDIWDGTVSLVTRIYGSLTHPSDDYGNIGFSDSGAFLAGLSGNDEEVLVITAGNTMIRNCRLVGCISGDFKGREWVFDTGGESVSRMTDTLETSCAVRKYDAAFQSEFLQKTNMYCENYLYNTRYIFSPAKIRLEASKEKTPGISEKNGSIVTEQKLSYRDSYLISCYVFNYGNPGIRDLIESAEPIDEAEWVRTAKAEDVLDKEGCSFEDYQQYRRDIYDRYCRSYGVSDEVGKILDEIKNGSSGRYETVKNLEAYLKKLKYSTDCGPLPDSVTDAESFLDWFLLSSGKGYCMHFATAFVLMANEMGIPCRYVQGYNAGRDVSGNITVKQSSAHAWPEVYFDNVGWIAFEPTPGFYVPAGWGTRAANADDPKNDKEDSGDELQEETDSETEDTVQDAGAFDPLIIIIPSAAVISFLLLFYAVSRFMSRRRYRRMSPYEKFRYLTQQDLRFLGLLGFRMEEGETLSEFADRIRSSGSEEIKNDLGFIPVWETVLYSGREITGEDISAAENICGSLRDIVKKSRLRLRVLLLIKRQ